MQGDNGSPLLVQLYPGGTWIQVGVVSRGLGRINYKNKARI